LVIASIVNSVTNKKRHGAAVVEERRSRPGSGAPPTAMT
jgi:hypothetical protein